MFDVTDLGKFWMTWWVQVTAATLTLCAVLVALFGQSFRAKFFPPKISLTLANLDGSKTRVRLQWNEAGTDHERWEEARYYHVRVTNSRRWSTANQVHVVLLRVDEPRADGQFTNAWAGDVPLGWRHQQVYPTLRTIGPSSEIDLCSVVRDKWLQLHPLIIPYNLDVVRRLDVARKSPVRLRLHLQARADECDSSPLCVEVSWDGQWHDGSQEMRKHLVLKVIEDAAV